jgi:hypothetical protein
VTQLIWFDLFSLFYELGALNSSYFLEQEFMGTLYEFTVGFKKKRELSEKVLSDFIKFL